MGGGVEVEIITGGEEEEEARGEGNNYKGRCVEAGAIKGSGGAEEVDWGGGVSKERGVKKCAEKE